MTHIVYQPNDSMVGPIVTALATIIRNQIAGVGTVYERDPDQSPLDNSVTLPMTDFKILDNTSGRLEIRYVFSVMHWFRRDQLGAGIQKCYSYLLPYLQAFGEWDNQTLYDPQGNPLTRIVSPKQGGVTSRAYYRTLEPHVALVINIEAITEILLNCTL